MTRPYSLDLRERVVAFVGEGQSRRSAASLFKIGISTVVRWCQRADATGSAAAKPMGGKRPYLLEDERDWLFARLAEKPDLTLHGLLAELRECRDVVVSCDTLWRFLRREGISFKKRLFTPPNRIALTSPEGGRGGRNISRGSPPHGWCLSTRPGRRPT
jgi:transposase